MLRNVKMPAFASKVISPIGISPIGDIPSILNFLCGRFGRLAGAYEASGTPLQKHRDLPHMPLGGSGLLGMAAYK